MKEVYRVIFQDAFEREKNRWCNAGGLMELKREYDNLEDAKRCMNKFIENRLRRSNTTVVNGIGITFETTSEFERKFLDFEVKIEKRQVTPWEEVESKKNTVK